ncbi:MAG TPA: hypothetical protein VGJ07_05895 [Rugosimonospora sp.]
MTIMGAAPRVRPGSGWRAGIWTSVALSLVYAALLAVTIPLLLRDARLLQAIATGGPVDVDTLQRDADQERVVAVLRVLVAVGYSVTFGLWYRTTRRWVRRHNGDDGGLRRHWGVMAWRVGWLAMLVLTCFGTPQAVDRTSVATLAASLRHDDRVQLFLTVVRLALVVFLVSALWAIRRWVLALPAQEAPIATVAPAAADPVRRSPAAAYQHWRARRNTRVYD